MVTLLAHSMMMFYLIGKGKAVKDAMTIEIFALVESSRIVDEGNCLLGA